MALEGKRVAVLAADNYQELELWYPVLYLRGEGAEVQVVGHEKVTYYSKGGYPVSADVAAGSVKSADFDAVVVPGGYAPDILRTYPAVLKLVSECFNQGKVVAAICHAGWVLVSAGILKGTTVTSTPTIKDDMINAGATWVDQEMVRDGKLVTSRMPDDLPAFSKAIAAAIQEG